MNGGSPAESCAVSVAFHALLASLRVHLRSVPEQLRAIVVDAPRLAESSPGCWTDVPRGWKAPAAGAEDMNRLVWTSCPSLDSFFVNVSAL